LVVAMIGGGPTEGAIAGGIIGYAIAIPVSIWALRLGIIKHGLVKG
jgi:hypothetical protein